VFIASPDGYRFKLVDDKPPTSDPVLAVSLNVSDINRSLDYWTGVLGLSLFSNVEVGGEVRATVGFSETQTKLELVQRNDAKGNPINHANAFGRIAFAIKDIHPIHKRVEASGDSVLHQPVRLETPGKADVEVVILTDRDGYEICFVGEVGFNDLSKPFDGADYINWEERTEYGGDKN